MDINNEVKRMDNLFNSDKKQREDLMIDLDNNIAININDGGFKAYFDFFNKKLCEVS